jgi:hypothetical protein
VLENGQDKVNERKRKLKDTDIDAADIPNSSSSSNSNPIPGDDVNLAESKEEIDTRGMS